MLSKILDVATHTPDILVSTQDLLEEIKSEELGYPTNWIKDVAGISACYQTQMHEKPSFGAVKSCEKLLDNNDLGLKREDIDILIFCGIEGDTSEPATAHIIQNKLGTKANIIFDVKNACYGFTQGMTLASHLIKSGLGRHALIVTSEISTQVVRISMEMLKKSRSKEDFEKWMGFYTGGDGAGAVLLGPGEDGSGFKAFETLVDSRNFQQCMYRVYPDIYAQMDMRGMTKTAVRLYTQLNKKYNEIHSPEQPHWFLSHQTGSSAFDFMTKLCNPSIESIKTFPNRGNLTTATFPVSYEALVKNTNYRPGQTIAGLFGGSGTITGKFEYIT